MGLAGILHGAAYSWEEPVISPDGTFSAQAGTGRNVDQFSPGSEMYINALAERC